MRPVSFVTVFVAIATSVVGASGAAEPAGAIHLPPPDTSGGVPLMQALNGRASTKEFASQPISQGDISNLLWSAFGINRPESGKRTVATAVNCQDIDIYVVFAEGAYVYEATGHSLIPVVNRDLRSLAATQEYATAAPIHLVYVSDHSKMPGGAKDKKALYAAFHAGAISQNVYLYCASAGLGTVVRDSVDRDGLRDALNLGAHQVIVMAQSVGYPRTE